MTRFKKCDECSALISGRLYTIKFRMIGLGETERGKEMLCSDCFDEWRDHENNCENPPDECFKIIRQTHNSLTILDARKDRYNKIIKRKTTDNYYDL